jgi:hypothetical protein
MPAGSSQPFRAAGTVSLSATTTPASIALAGGGDSVLITNAASSIAFVRFGADATVSANTGDMPVLPNSQILIAVNSLIQNAAAVLTSGTGSVYFTRGDGSNL